MSRMERPVCLLCGHYLFATIKDLADSYRCRQCHAVLTIDPAKSNPPVVLPETQE